MTEMKGSDIDVISDDDARDVKDRDDDSMDEEEDEDEDEDDDNAEEFNPIDFGQLLSNFFVTENGENVADALMGMKKSLDTHNKIMMKMLNK